LEKRLAAEEFGYIKAGPLVRGSFGFSVNSQEEPVARTLTAQASSIGARLHWRDEKFVAQFSIEGFTFSRLPPYELWKQVIAKNTASLADLQARHNPACINQ
jgi:hypothetical protein